MKVSSPAVTEKEGFLLYKFVLFDLDGTLTDPIEGILKSVRYALHKEGLSTQSNEDLSWVIGPPLKESFAQLANTTDEAVLKRLLSGYRERFGTVGLYENLVFDGIPELLAELVELGSRLYIATSKPTVYAEKIIEHFHLDRFFTAIAGSELNESRTHKGEVIRYLLSTSDIVPGQSIMVGDRMHDVLGARENGIRTIGVLYGYSSESELQNAGAAYVARSITELHHLLTVNL